MLTRWLYRQENGSITFKYSILGANNLFTADEKNIQAILATQFDDFGNAFYGLREICWSLFYTLASFGTGLFSHSLAMEYLRRIEMAGSILEQWCVFNSLENKLVI